MLDSTCGTEERLMKSYATLMPWLQNTWVGIVGIRVIRSVTVRSWILFYVGNCASLSDFFANNIRGGFYYPMKKRPLERALQKKLSRQCWKKICPGPPPLFYYGGVRQNTYFYYRGYYGGCGQIGCTKTIREFGTRGYASISSEGVEFKIWGVKQKPLYYCWSFCWLPIQYKSALVIISFIYVWLPYRT